MVDLKQALQQVPMLANLSDEQIEWLAQQGTEHSFSAGTQLAQQGDPPDGFYIILQGDTGGATSTGNRFGRLRLALERCLQN